MTRLKTVLATTAAAALLAANGSAQQSAPVQIIDQARNIAVLNAQNLGERSYDAGRAPADATQFAFELKGYVFGIRLIKSQYIGYVGEREYAAYADAKTAGLGALLKKMEIWAVTKGRVGADGTLRPDWHVQQNTDKKNRRVEMNYDNGARGIDVNIVPPLGSQGVPAATPAERFSAMDTLTTLLHMAKPASADELCTRSVPVFDSKQRYNLRLEPVGSDRVKFLGDKQEAIHCHVYYEPVAGFDPEDLPTDEEAATPVDVYFQYFDEANMYVPVRFSYKVSGFKAIVKVSDLTVIEANTGRLVTYGD